VRSTELAANIGDRAWHDVVERHHGFVRGVIARWRGREMDTAGDGFFAAFDGPARAIRCAQAVVSGVRSMGIEVRAGLHTGECDITDNKVAGIAVAIGSRIASLAAPSQILVSRTVRDLVAGSGEVRRRWSPQAQGRPRPLAAVSSGRRDHSELTCNHAPHAPVRGCKKGVLRKLVCARVSPAAGCLAAAVDRRVQNNQHRP
jgi:class 3 adenylate cyclase